MLGDLVVHYVMTTNLLDIPMKWRRRDVRHFTTMEVKDSDASWLATR